MNHFENILRSTIETGTNLQNQLFDIQESIRSMNDQILPNLEKTIQKATSNCYANAPCMSMPSCKLAG